MSSSNQALNLETPKLCCVPARPLVVVLAFISLVRGIVTIILTANVGERVIETISIFFTLLLLFGAVRNNEPALKWSQRVVLVSVVFAFIQFLIWPVMIASYAASGLADVNGTLSEMSDDLYKADDQKSRMFAHGLLLGYSLELGTVILVGGEVLKYVLVNRLWKYAKSTEYMGSNQYIAA